MMESGGQQIFDRACIFVSSSDRTRDVFLQVYAQFIRMWPSCAFRQFVGLTTGVPGESILGFAVVPSAGESTWPRELADQVRELPAHISFVVLLLDDFLLLEPVDEQVLTDTVREAARQDCAYVRLKPVERSWLVATARRALAVLTSRKFLRLSNSEPYFSSLQASVWRRDHLLASLQNAETIWQFENVVLPGVAHWAVKRPVLRYRHVVEKGTWQADAPALFRRLGLMLDPGRRPIKPPSKVLFYMWQKLKFGLIGYSGMRLKRTLAKKFSSNDQGTSFSLATGRQDQRRGQRQQP